MKFIKLLSILVILATASQAQNLEEKNTFGPRPDLKGDLTFSFGLNMLMNNEVLDLRTFGNNSFKVGYLYPVQIGNTNFTFNGGLAISFEKYAFDSAATLGFREDASGLRQSVVIDSIGNTIIGDGVVDKSKFEANYLNIPIEFRYYINKDKIGKGFFVAAGGSIGYLISGKTKIRYIEDEEVKKVKRKESFELNQFRYGAHFRVGFAGFGAFLQYDFSEVFNPGRGPQNTNATPYRFGLSFNLF